MLLNTSIIKSSLGSTMLISAAIVGTMVYWAPSASAHLAPTGCFLIGGVSGEVVVLDYYDYVDNSSANAPCPRDVTIPNELDGDLVTEIDDGAFMDKGITSVDLPDSLTEININAFAYNSIRSVEIPSSVVSIDERAFASQSPEGVDAWSTIHGTDAVATQDVMDQIWYVTLITEDASNPNGLADSVVTEAEIINRDGNGNGSVNDSLGGHLINRTPLTVSYRDTSGAQVRPSETFFGRGVDSYLVSDNPDGDISRYYAIGDNVTYIAPAVAGYVTPSASNVVLTRIEYEDEYVYTPQAPSEPEVTTPVEPKKPTPTVPSTGAFDLTGNIKTILLSAGVAVAAVGIALRRLTLR